MWMQKICTYYAIGVLFVFLTSQLFVSGHSGLVDKVYSISKISQSENEEIIDPYTLTERELEVLQLIVEGCSNALIAERLYITVGTVKTHVRNILNKLCADDRTQAAVRALRSGLVG